MREALQLPREARALIAEKLLDSLGFEEPCEVSREWKEEIARRCREIDDGTAELIPGDSVESRDSLSASSTGSETNRLR